MLVACGKYLYEWFLGTINVNSNYFLVHGISLGAISNGFNAVEKEPFPPVLDFIDSDHLFGYNCESKQTVSNCLELNISLDFDCYCK